ncbi:hypothetical protein EN812_33460, partial [Mesorhizobium sp. M4B.F.Ca.ET.169.01.1.1]|uniref:hypothetical protein n=1 Tax=Mesorhizobium sp. M4B.F.Ca.ET.169.01.1.1 TaxID=2563949 RepID=UPI0010939E30
MSDYENVSARDHRRTKIEAEVSPPRPEKSAHTAQVPPCVTSMPSSTTARRPEVERAMMDDGMLVAHGGTCIAGIAAPKAGSGKIGR